MSVNAIACGARGVADVDRNPMVWSGYAGTLSRAASATEAVPTEPTALWASTIGRLASGPPALGDDVLIVMGVDRWLNALNPENGNRRWRSRLNAGGSADVVVADGHLFVATTGFAGRLYRYRLRGGHVWSRDIGAVAGGLAVMDGQVIAVTEHGGVVAHAVDDGAETWRRRVPGPVRGGVTPLGNDLLIATFDSLFVLRSTDGTVRTRAGSPGAVLGAPAVAGALIVVGSPDGLVAGLNHDLVEQWRVPTSGEVTGGVAVARDTAFAVTNRGVLYRIPLGAPMAYDSIVLDRPVLALPAPVATGVLIGTAGGEVVFVGVGAPLGRTLFRVDGPILHPPVVRGRTIYVADGRGKVEAWR